MSARKPRKIHPREIAILRNACVVVADEATHLDAADPKQRAARIRYVRAGLEILRERIEDLYSRAWIDPPKPRRRRRVDASAELFGGES